MCSLYSIYMCIQLYSAKGINDVTLSKKITFVWFVCTLTALSSGVSLPSPGPITRT